MMHVYVCLKTDFVLCFFWGWSVFVQIVIFLFLFLCIIYSSNIFIAVIDAM